MKKKQLYIMAAIFAALIILGIAFRDKEPENIDIEAMAQLEKILPESVSMESIAAIEICRGKAKAGDNAESPKVVRISRDDAVWRVESSWSAPANLTKIKDFFSTLKAARGETVSENSERYGEYLVSDEKALWVRMFDAKGKAVYELAVGKERGRGGSLIRMVGSPKVFAIEKNLRQELSVWGEDADPEGSAWLDTEIVNVDKDKIKKVELTYPDHVIAFEKIEVLKGEDKKDETRKGVIPPVAESNKKEYEWRLMSRSPGGEFKKDGLNSLLDAASHINASDVLDPAKKADLGLDKPGYRLAVTLEDGSRKEFFAARIPADNKGVFIVKDGDTERYYEMAGWSFDNIFKSGGEFFSLNTPNFETDKISSLKVTCEADEILIAKDGENWKLERPASKFKLKQDEVKKVLEALSSWKAKDYTDPSGMVQYGISLPSATLEIKYEDGTRKTLIKGLGHPGIKGAYVTAGAKEPVFVMSTDDADKIFLELDKLVDLSEPLVGKSAKDAKSLTIVNKSGESIYLRKGAAWEVSADNKDWKQADKDKAEGYLDILSGVTARFVLSRDKAREEYIGGYKAIFPNDKNQPELPEGAKKTSPATISIDEKLLLTLIEGSSTRYAVLLAGEMIPFVMIPSDGKFLTKARYEDFLPAVEEKTGADTNPVTTSKTIKNPFEK